MAKAISLSEGAQEALNLFEEGCAGHHRTFIEKVERRYRAFDGVIEGASNADRWTSKLAPPYVNHIAETSLAALLEGKLAFRVKPLPRFYDPGEFELLTRGAEAHEILHKSQLCEERFDEIQRPFALQDAIAGLTVAKSFWKREKGGRPFLAYEPGIMGLPGKLVEMPPDPDEVLYDGPVTEVVDVRDFFWHEAATTLQRSPIIVHRTWMHFTELKAAEKQGRFKNVDQVKESRDNSDEYNSREIERDNRNRSKDMIEVLEIWWRKPDGIYVCTLGNRKAELTAPKKNPFWHGEYPFVACSTRPNLFSISGKSLVERIADLQEGYWDVSNQATDNLRLVNNFITAINTSIVDDPDAFEYEPGARWPVSGPVDEAVKTLSPDPTSAQIALGHLGKLEQQMQNLAAGQAFTSTSEARNVGADTATEAALTQNIAQAATRAMKEQINFAYGRIGQQRMMLNQQFLREEILVEKVGLDNESEMVEISPLLLQGDYYFDISPMQQQMLKSEQQASANALMTMFGQIIGPWTALVSAGAATPLNADEFARTWLKAFDDGDIERYFSKRPQPQGQLPGPAGPQPQSQGPSGPGNVTAEPAASANPSEQASVAPAVLMQRIRSMAGGANNV